MRKDIIVGIPKARAEAVRQEKRLLESGLKDDWIRLRVAIRIYNPGKQNYVEPNRAGMHIKCRSVEAAMVVKKAIVEAIANLDGIQVEG